MNMLARFTVGNRPHRFNREEYLRMAELGLFRGRKVELIGGEIIDMAAQDNWHAKGVQALMDALQPAFGPGYWVRCQMTLDLSPLGIPDPDVAVVAGGWRTHPNHGIPTEAVLVVEVSDTSLRDDQTYKMGLDAAAGVKDYWVLNLGDVQLEVYRGFEADPGQPFGTRSDAPTILRAGDTISPLAAPQTVIAVADLLP